jgi:hypothetical protein
MPQTDGWSGYLYAVLRVKQKIDASYRSLLHDEEEPYEMKRLSCALEYRNVRRLSAVLGIIVFDDIQMLTEVNATCAPLIPSLPPRRCHAVLILERPARIWIFTINRNAHHAGESGHML